MSSFVRFKSDLISVKKKDSNFVNQFNEALQKIPAFVVGQSTEKLVSLCLSLKVFIASFFCIRPPPELLPVLGLLDRYMTPTLDAALLCSSRASSDLGRKSDCLRSYISDNLGNIKSNSIYI